MTKSLTDAIFPVLAATHQVNRVAALAVSEAEMIEYGYLYMAQIVKNSQAMAEVLASEGLRVLSGGTDNHLILLDLTSLGITGLEAETALGKAHIMVNKNTIPNESRSPFVTSGLRVGTPAVTS